VGRYAQNPSPTMQLMADSLAVLGSRHGLVCDPIHGRCGIVRFDRFDQLPELHLRAGLCIDGRERVLPLCPEGLTPTGRFDFIDQRIGPATMRWIGVDGPSALRVTLEIAVPFRLGDLAFSSTPVVALRLSVARLGGKYRYTPLSEFPEQVELFVEFAGAVETVAAEATDALELRFDSRRLPQDVTDRQLPLAALDLRPQLDLLVAPGAARAAQGFRRTMRIDCVETLDVYWCARPQAGFVVRGEPCPLDCEVRFANLTAVADWARVHGREIHDAAAQTAALGPQPEGSVAQRRLLAYTLHSWLLNTWLAWRPDGRRWFSVWEGSCYFHSTIDVEYTQAPFYLQHWPELLALQLDQWAEYAEEVTRESALPGEGSRFLPHDVGRYSEANRQAYPHQMEVEETTNWLILLCAHARRADDRQLVHKHASLVRAALAFLHACDTDGTGVPVHGVANTIDDGSPAIQFGRAQTYLAVKVLAALIAGLDLGVAGALDVGATTRATDHANRLRTTIETKAWRGDHYAVLVEPGGTIKDPWTGEITTHTHIPGWDAPHIYTCNGLAVLDLVGLDTGLDPVRLRTDLVTATAACLREYGCVHTAFTPARAGASEAGDTARAGLAGQSRNPGWVAMNLLRDLAAAHRGLDHRDLAERYWDWQVTTNTQEPKLFFETFNGNNLCFYPRGVACWGWFRSWQPEK